MRAAILGLLLALAPLPANAAGALHHSLVEKANVIAGKTAAEIYRSMLRDPIVDPDSGNALANLTHDHELSFTTKASDDQCRVAKLDFTWRFVMTLPRARNESALPAKTRKLWRSFVARLRSHELHHRDLFVNCGQTFVPKAAAMTAPQCSSLDRQVRRFVDAQYDACMEIQFAYDRQDTRKIQAHAFIKEAKR